MACRLTVELHDTLHTQGAQQSRYGQTAGGVDGIHGHLEVGFGNGLAVNERQGEDALYVTVDPVLLDSDLPQVVDLGVAHFAALGQAQDLLALGVVDKFAFGIEQLKSVPMLGVVAGGDDDAAVATGVDDGHLGGRRGAEAGLKDVDAHTLKGADNEAVDHSAAEARVATHSQAQALAAVLFLQEGGESRRELDNINGAEALAGDTAYGAADS